MKNLTKILLFCLLVYATLTHAQVADTIKVGIRTVNLALDGEGMIQALSEGRDLNFDSVLVISAGERPGALFRIDPATRQVVASRAFPGFIYNLAVRGNVGYFLQSKPLRLSSYNTTTLETLQDTLILSDPANSIELFDVSVDEVSGQIYIGTGGFSRFGAILVFDNSGTLLHRAKTGLGTTEALFVDEPTTGSRAAYVINQGTFGSENATLSYLNMQPTLFKNRTGRNLGALANDMTIAPDGRLYIAVNGSHTVEVFDVNNHQSIGTIQAGTSGFNGPRQVVLLPDGKTGVVSTFTNDVRFFDLQTLQLTDTIAVGQKPEHIAVVGDFVYVANGGFTGFAEDSTVFVIDWKKKAIVDTIVAGIRTTQLQYFPATSLLYALSEGRDLNFDDTLQVNAGERPGRLVAIDPNTNQIVAEKKLSSFAKNLTVGEYVADGQTFLLVYAVQTEPTRISVFQAISLETEIDTLLMEDPDKGITFYNLAFDRDRSALLISTGGFSEAGGGLLVFDTQSREIIHRFQTGIGASDAIAINTPGIPGSRRWFVLNEGFFGSETSTLSLIDFGQEIFEPIAGTKLGDTANGGTIAEGRLYIAVNGSHTVQVLDIVNRSYAGKVEVGTTGFDGPRKVAILPGGSGLVTTFANDIRAFDRTSLKVTKITPTGNKPEDALVVGDQVFVANGGFTGFAEDSTIFVYKDTTVPVHSHELPIVPGTLKLAQNYPNPFFAAKSLTTSPVTMMSFTLPSPMKARLEIFNLLGQRVAVLANGVLTAGAHTYAWNGRDMNGRLVASGMYYYRLEAEGKAMVRRMMLQR
jgi:WD40 repeat protein